MMTRSGLTSIPVDSIQAVFDLMAVADRNRSSTATNMNEHSSRSHMMLTVTVVSEFLPTKAQFRGKLNLVVSALPYHIHSAVQYQD
jgi:kinesin family protein C2/C3